MAAPHRIWWITAPLAGGLAALALPPLGWPPLLWLALLPLWSLAAALPPRQVALAGAGWGAAAVLVSHRWLLWLHPLDWIGVPGPLSLPLCLVLWLLCGLAGGLLVACWTLLVDWLDPRRGSTALLAALIWGLAETALARGPLFWIGIASAVLPGDPALAGLGAIGGPSLLAALQLLIAWLLWQGLRGARQPLRPLALLVLLLLLGHGLGAAALALPPPAAQPLPPQRWLVLQPAVPTRQKFEPPQQRRLLALLEQAGAEAAAGGAQGLLLPEGALPLAPVLPEPTPVELLSGGFRQVGMEQRSSLLRFAPGSLEPDAWLDKHRLVPLGEWVPLGEVLRWAGLSAVGGLSPGEASRLLPRPGGPIAAAICYELADATALARAVRHGARWLVASANLDPYPPLLQAQFQTLARLRAIETGRWLVSAANTGPTLLVDAQGQLRRQLPPLRPLTSLMDIQPLQGLTPYVRWGEWPLLGLALALGAWRLVRAGRPAGPTG